MEFGRAYVERFGRPISFYVDRDSIYVTSRQASIEEELRDSRPLTQFARAMEKNLGISLIKARSPQARGRIERLFGILQDRLVKEMRLAQIETIEEANKFLERYYIPWHNQRFSLTPLNSFNAHRPLGKTKEELDSIFSIQEFRTISNDFTIRWKGRVFQVESDTPFSLLSHSIVLVEEHLDGKIKIKFKNKYLNFYEIHEKNTLKTLPKRNLKREKKGAGKNKYIPPSSHPWRKDFHRWVEEALMRKSQSKKI